MELSMESDRTKVLEDLFTAYYDARKHKRNTVNALIFERNFETNLFELCDEIIERRYDPRPSICFMVTRPVKREVFAADFRDRVIHHFIFNYISPIFERCFINDSYSCRKGKGIHYGVKRVDHFIRSCSGNYTRDCYILKIDIRGYFMSMNRSILFEKIKKELYRDVSRYNFDLSLVVYLIEKTIFNDPTDGCRMKGRREDWNGLPRSKSLFHAVSDCGLPIGNLTSQLFGNVYMNDFDHFVKRDLNIKYYGRYVDDMVIVHEDKEYLKSIIGKMRNHLMENERLELHPNKIYLQHYSKGVAFIGAFIKKHRIYIVNRTKGNFYQAIYVQNKLIEDHAPSEDEVKKFISSINSYLGLTKHYATYNIRKKMVFEVLSKEWWKYVYLDGRIEKFVMKRKEKGNMKFE